MMPEGCFPPPGTAQNGAFIRNHFPMTTLGYGDFFSASNSTNFVMNCAFAAEGPDMLPGGVEYFSSH